MRLLAWVRSPAKYESVAKTAGVALVELDHLLGDSDFVSIHLPLTSDTRHLLDARRLALMKPTATLINTARGAIVDEAALIESLQHKRIAGAALDVFEGIDVFALDGGPPNHPLLALDNVILTPHCAGSSVESTRDSKGAAAFAMPLTSWKGAGPSMSSIPTSCHAFRYPPVAEFQRRQPCSEFQREEADEVHGAAFIKPAQVQARCDLAESRRGGWRTTAFPGRIPSPGFAGHRTSLAGLRVR